MSWGCRKHWGSGETLEGGCPGCNEEHPNHSDNPDTNCRECRQDGSVRKSFEELFFKKK